MPQNMGGKGGRRFHFQKKRSFSEPTIYCDRTPPSYLGDMRHFEQIFRVRISTSHPKSHMTDGLEIYGRMHTYSPKVKKVRNPRQTRHGRTSPYKQAILLIPSFPQYTRVHAMLIAAPTEENRRRNTSSVEPNAGPVSR